MYKKEMLSYFTHMMGYVFLAFMLLVIGIFFVFGNVMVGSANFHFTLASTTTFFFILIPTLTMRLFSEETRQKTDQLIFTSPLSVGQIVLGKFLAAVSLFLIAVVISVVMPLMLSFHTSLPLAQIVGTYIGFVFIGIALIAVGVFISVLTENQIIAAVITMAAIFTMFIIDTVATIMPTSTMASLVFVLLVVIVVVLIWYNATRNIVATVPVAALGITIAGGLYLFDNFIYDGIIVRSILWFSAFARFQNFSQGLLNLSDIVYYISFIALFVYITINVIEKRRWK